MLMRKTKNYKHCKLVPGDCLGFSLVELIIVVAVVGIIAAIATPAIISWLPSIYLKAAAQELYADLHKAKIVAIKKNRDSVLTFVAGVGAPCSGGSYTIVNDTETVANKSMEHGVCLSTTLGFPDGFKPTGLPAGAFGSINLTHSKTDRSYTITQTSAGGIRMK